MSVRKIIVASIICVLSACSLPSGHHSTQDQEAAFPEAKVFRSVDDVPLVKLSLSDGPGLAAWFNSEYNDSDNFCRQPGNDRVRGHYFCSGVLLRTVDNGDFSPWDYSPVAMRLRGVSFSWIRHDVGITNLYHRAGYIVLSPEAAINNYVPGIKAQDSVTCVYPFDAWTTRTMDRDHAGCDFEGSGISDPQPNWSTWGSCRVKLGLTTADQWNAHFTSVNQVNYKQCSWGSDNPTDWQSMIASRRNFSGQQSWNEVMLQVIINGNVSMHAWITAFFYDVHKSGGLADARVFQQKMAGTGKRVPILRLDFAANTLNRFEYVVADQVTYP